jgi:uncharacterized protein (DUF2164 family)
MAIRFPSERRGPVIAAIRDYFETELDEPIGDLKATLLFEFMLAEIGPTVYNQAIADAQAWMQERVTDLDVNLYEPETTGKTPQAETDPRES